MSLTDRQVTIIRMIKACAREGFVPRLTEIAAGTGLGSAQAAHYQMRQLAAKGYLLWPRLQHRSVRLTDKALALVEEPKAAA